MRLNIGCSTDTWGDVRLDVACEYLKSRSAANIYGDAQTLPFKNQSFEETKAWNVLEHLPNWRGAVRDWCRVTDKKLQIEVPMDAGFTKQELFAELFSLSFSYIMKLPTRRKQHLWQFSPQSIINELASNEFDGYLSYECAPLFFRDENRVAANSFIKFIHHSQRKIRFGYLITAYRKNK